MPSIDAELLRQLSLTHIDRVTFYKRDELTTDLIFCDVEINGSLRTFHEELEGWDELLQHLYKLPNFRTDWYASVCQPPFEVSETVAFHRG